ncbi:MAG: DNA-binding response regulator [Frankiales bacterium]|nr:DNA-binding response regulator [Frankiales bacterium]
MSGLRVLVVEDDPSVRGLLHTLLSAEGYDVATAPDGLAGLVKAAASPPGLILLDLMMPDLGGVSVIEHLRQDPDLSAVPVLVVTGQEEAVPDIRLLVGAENVFLKPFAVSELLARVGDLTGGPVTG